MKSEQQCTETLLFAVFTENPTEMATLWGRVLLGGLGSRTLSGWATMSPRSSAPEAAVGDCRPGESVEPATLPVHALGPPDPPFLGWR